MRLACSTPLPWFIGCELHRKGQPPLWRWTRSCAGWVQKADTVVRHGALVAENVGVDDPGPAIDSPCEGLDVLEPLVAKPHSDGEGTDSVVTEDDDGLVGVQLLVGAGGDLPHGHEERVWKGRCVELPWLADIQDQGRIAPLTLEGQSLCGDFGFKHEIKDNVKADGLAAMEIAQDSGLSLWTMTPMG